MEPPKKRRKSKAAEPGTASEFVGYRGGMAFDDGSGMGGVGRGTAAGGGGGKVPRSRTQNPPPHTQSPHTLHLPANPRAAGGTDEMSMVVSGGGVGAGGGVGGGAGAGGGLGGGGDLEANAYSQSSYGVLEGVLGGAGGRVDVGGR